MRVPVTPDGRCFVVRGRLWRYADPALRAARDAADAARHALGGRGPAWWTDGAPDHDRRLARNAPYADWYAALPPGADA